MNKKIVSLFAGAGGLDLGFKKAGFQIIASCEINKYAVETHNFNFKLNSEVVDITNDKSYSKFITKAKKHQPKILIGGFPCQGYSMTGKRDIDDKRNQLYKKVVSVMKDLNIKYFILENVPGILSMNKGETIKIIEKYFNDNGYYFTRKILDSSKLGVPQIRKRVIFIGSNVKNKIPMCDLILEKLSLINKKLITTKKAISDLENAPENIDFNHIYTKHTESMIQKIKNTEIGKSVYKTYSDGWRKLDYNKPAPTVKENHGGVHVHPISNRALTPRELARLQSFPDNFIFKGTKNAQLVQIGNAVPVLMAKEIARAFKKEFFND